MRQPQIAIKISNTQLLNWLNWKGNTAGNVLNLSGTDITIHSASSSTEEAQAKMKEVSDQARELFQSMQPRPWFAGLESGSWVTTLLKPLGLTGWGKWLAQAGIAIVTGFVFLIVGISLVKCMITHLFILRSPSVHYPSIITMREEHYIHVPQGNVEPRGGML